jgi:hypothetical protein
VSAFETLERFVPPEHIDAWRKWVAYTARYEPTDEIGHICQAAGWLALLTRQTPEKLAAEGDQFLVSLAARFENEHAQREELKKEIKVLGQTFEDEAGKVSQSARAAQEEFANLVRKANGQLRGEVEKLQKIQTTIWGVGLCIAFVAGISVHLVFSLLVH